MWNRCESGTREGSVSISGNIAMYVCGLQALKEGGMGQPE